MAIDNDRIERDVLIAAPMSRVWTLVTSAEHLGSWFGDAGAEVDLRPGGAMSLRWQDHGTHRAVVEVVEPESRFVFHWSRTQDIDVIAGESTRVEFSLAPAEGGTRLRVIETGFTALNGDEASQIAHRAGNVEGWTSELDELVRYAETVAVVA